ncbi:MAG: sulfite exporter TauE/SafE family protein [Bryobacteraceae bacterium]|nr:sulfite exporter TauE/SafE family protein [Bryobacteraceae bacterium]
MIENAAGIGFALGLAGSLHCASMCGPIVLAVGMPVSGASRLRRLLLHGAYHLGRVATYALLGMAAGWLGSGVSMLGGLARLENAAALVSGGLMVITALVMVGSLRRPGLVEIGPAPWLTRASARLLQSVSPLRKAGLGLMMGLLPCGMVYAALLGAAASANALDGAVMMAAFGAATALPLLGIGLVSSALGGTLRKWSPKLTPAAIAVLGVILIWRGLNPPEVAAHVHHH